MRNVKRSRGCVAWMVFVVGLAMAGHSWSPAVQAQDAEGVVPNQWIVTLAPSVNPNAQAFGLAQAAGGQVGRVYTSVLNGFSFHGPAAAAQALLNNPLVRTVVPNRVVRMTQTLPAGIRRIDASHPTAIDAHDQGFTGTGIPIAILDTGIDLDHDDLKLNILQNYGINCIDPARPPDDGNGHGTHVAGTAAAVNNALGVIGVAPSASLVPVKVLDDSGSGSWESVICGVDHVTTYAHVIRVANMSLSGPGSATNCLDGGLHQAICESVARGVVYTVAAGNSRRNVANDVPAAYPEVITVSAVADYNGEPGGGGGCVMFIGLGQICDDTFAKFSNFGAGVDVTAPGVRVYSTDRNNGYGTKDGTSMAAPHVAGIVALMRSVNSGLDPAAVKARLKEAGECPNGSWNTDGGDCTGQGQWTNDPDGIAEPLVNALRAAELAYGSGGSTNTPPTADNVSISGDEDAVEIAWAPVVDDLDAEATLTCTIATAPANGSATVMGDCSAGTYTPTRDYYGSDEFTYRVTDGSATATGTVRVTVNPVNDAPVSANDSYSVAAGGTLAVAAPGVLANDADVDGDTLTAQLEPGLSTSNGTLEFNPNGSFTYVPNAGFIGVDTFWYRARDGEVASEAAEVTITVSEVQVPTAISIEDLAGASTNNGSTWTAHVTITVFDNTGTPVVGATATGDWSTSASGSCVTGGDGRCVVNLSGLAKKVGSVQFRVTTLIGALPYDGTANKETSITVSKP